MEFLLLGGLLATVAFLLKSRQAAQEVNRATTPAQQIAARKTQIQTGEIATFTATFAAPGANVVAASKLPQFGPLGEGCAVGSNCQFQTYVDLFAYNKTQNEKYVNPYYQVLSPEQRDYILSLGYYTLTPQEKADMIFRDTGIMVKV